MNGNRKRSEGVRPSTELHREQGSFLIAAALFMLLFLGVAALGVDGARYYMKQNNLQNIADGAALKGAQAFNQFDTRPKIARVNEAILSHIEATQGPKYRDLYEVNSPEEVEGIIVRKLRDGTDECEVDFNINDGSVNVSEPFNAQTRVLGSAVSAGPGTRENYPVTARVRVENEDSSDTTFNPWGNWGHPNDANLNNPGAKPSLDLTNYPPDKDIAVDARYYANPSGPSADPAAEKASSSDDVKVLRDGDTVPEIQGGHQQDSAAEYVEDYINEDGKIDLENNQAIYLFELTHDEGDQKADFQDLVMLMSFQPSGGNGSRSSRVNQNPRSAATYAGQCSPGTPLYKVGVLTYGKFRPFFLPDEVFEGSKTYGLNQMAVAEVSYNNTLETINETPNCGLFAEDSVMMSGNNFDASGMNVCSNGDIAAGQSNNGTMGDMYSRKITTINPPGGQSGEKVHLPQRLKTPTFKYQDSSQYDVDLGEFEYWSDQGYCNSGHGNGNGNNNDVTSKALRTQGGSTDFLQWSNGGYVCVNYDDDFGKYTIDPNGNPGQIQFADGSPVTIYSDEDITLKGNGTGLNGGLYSEGHIKVKDNNHTFSGDPGKLGGLSLWSEKSLDVQKNNVHIDGLVGSLDDFTFGSDGGGSGPTIDGRIITHGQFTLESNSGNAMLNHNESMYNEAALSNTNGEIFAQQNAEQPLYSNIRVELIE